MQRNAKARKILGRVGLTTNVTHLAKTMEALRTLSEEDLAMMLGMSDKALQACVQDVWDAIHVKVDLPLVSGGAFRLPMVSLTLALQHITRTYPSFRGLLTALYRKRPCTLANHTRCFCMPTRPYPETL
jgi:hypothetical protein